MNILELQFFNVRNFEYNNTMPERECDLTAHIDTKNTVNQSDKIFDVILSFSLTPTDKENKNFRLILELDARFSLLQKNFSQTELEDECVKELYPHLRAIVSATTAIIHGKTLFLPSIIFPQRQRQE